MHSMDTAHLFRGNFGKYMVAAPEEELLSVRSSAVSKRGAGVPRISTRARHRGARRHTSTRSQAGRGVPGAEPVYSKFPARQERVNGMRLGVETVTKRWEMIITKVRFVVPELGRGLLGSSQGWWRRRCCSQFQSSVSTVHFPSLLPPSPSFHPSSPPPPLSLCLKHTSCGPYRPHKLEPGTQ